MMTQKKNLHFPVMPCNNFRRDFKKAIKKRDDKLLSKVVMGAIFAYGRELLAVFLDVIFANNEYKFNKKDIEYWEGYINDKTRWRMS